MREKVKIQESLFEKISGHFVDGTPIDSYTAEGTHIKSVCDHLFRLLNTRQGTLSHMPDYGMPDMADLYSKLPISAPVIEEEFLKLIENYEPRLERVRVSIDPFSPLDFKLKMHVSGYLKNGQRVELDSAFHQNGSVEVKA